MSTRSLAGWMTNPRMLVVFSVFVLPYLITYLPALRPVVARTIAAGIPITVLTVGSFWWSIDPRTDVMAAGAKLRQPEFARQRPVIELVVRALGVAFGVFFTAVVAVPYVRDVVEFVDRGPTAITGTVRSVSGLIIGLPLMKQSIYLAGAGRGRSFTLLYSLRPVRAGESYKFEVLPLSRIVVDAQRLAAE